MTYSLLIEAFLFNDYFLLHLFMQIDLTGLLNLQRIDLATAIQQALQVHEKDIIELNDSQLDQGIDSNSDDLGSYKKFSYKGRFKPIDLKLQGDFRKAENIQIVHDVDSFSFVDTDYKTPFLTKKYGAAILGLTDQNIDRTAQLILPDVIINLETQLS